MPASPPRWRIWASRVFLVLFCLSMVLSVVGIWARNQIVDTDRYMRTVAPLASDPALQSALVARISNQVSTLIDDVSIGDPERDRILAAPLKSLVEEYITQTVQEFVTSDQFPPLWEEINRASHALTAAVLTGKNTQSVSTAGGQIILDIEPLLNEVINRLSERGVPLVDRIQLANWDTTFVLFESDTLLEAQDYISLLERLAVVLPIVALISLVAAIAFSVRRRMTIVWAGLGLAAAMAIFVLLLAYVRNWTVNSLPTSVHKDAATAFFEIVGRYLRDAARILTLVGLLIAGIAFFVRPGGWAKRESSVLRTRISGAWDNQWPRLESAAARTLSHPAGLAVAIGVIAALFAIAWDPLSVTGATAIILGSLIGFGALWLLHSRLDSLALAAPMQSSSVYIEAAAPDASLPKASEMATTADDARAELVALTSTLSPEDVRLLRRIALGFRNVDTG
jgi:hypothetical protein